GPERARLSRLSLQSRRPAGGGGLPAAPDGPLRRQRDRSAAAAARPVARHEAEDRHHPGADGAARGVAPRRADRRARSEDRRSVPARGLHRPVLRGRGEMRTLVVRSISQARYLLFGALTLLCGFQILIVGQAAEIQNNNSFGRMADLMPQFLQRNLGSKAMLLATFRGTVAFGYFHPVVCILMAGLAMYITTE